MEVSGQPHTEKILPTCNKSFPVACGLQSPSGHGVEEIIPAPVRKWTLVIQTTATYISDLTVSMSQFFNEEEFRLCMLFFM
jgi:hypothetical protein